jgi:hypothetical protein
MCAATQINLLVNWYASFFQSWREFFIEFDCLDLSHFAITTLR